MELLALTPPPMAAGVQDNGHLPPLFQVPLALAGGYLATRATLSTKVRAAMQDSLYSPIRRQMALVRFKKPGVWPNA